MTYPSQFFSTKKGSEVSYSRTPSGYPDINRLINGQPCWKSGFANVKKQKTLVLADWTASQWSPMRQEMIKTQLRKLVHDGFNIYMWQDGKI